MADELNPPFAYQARQWAEEGARVECFSGRDPSDVVHEGRIIGMTEAPTVHVQKDDGQIVSWVLGITRKKTAVSSSDAPNQTAGEDVAPKPGDPAEPREGVGRFVRHVWVEWARDQLDPKPSWLLPWEELDDGQREVDMRIGAALFEAGTRSVVAVAESGLRDELLRCLPVGFQDIFADAPVHRLAVELSKLHAKLRADLDAAGIQLLHRNREYGRASATIGLLRGDLARNRAQNAEYWRGMVERRERERDIARAELASAETSRLRFIDRAHRTARETGCLPGVDIFDHFLAVHAELKALKANAIVLPEHWREHLSGAIKQCRGAMHPLDSAVTGVRLMIESWLEQPNTDERTTDDGRRSDVRGLRDESVGGDVRGETGVRGLRVDEEEGRRRTDHTAADTPDPDTEEEVGQPDTEGLEYIRSYYKVPARIGVPVLFEGKPGVITGSSGPHLLVHIDGADEPVPAHPTWEMQYLTAEVVGDQAPGGEA